MEYILSKIVARVPHNANSNHCDNDKQIELSENDHSDLESSDLNEFCGEYVDIDPSVHMVIQN